MGLLLAAAFLFLPCAFLSSGVSQQSQLLKRHTAAPQHAGAGAHGGQWEDGCNLRQFRETLVSSLEDTGLPHFGARSHLLLDTETHGFLVQDDLLERWRGGPMQAGPPRLGTKQRRRERFGGPPPPPG